MIHAEYITGNPITGRQCWLVRAIPSDNFGDRWDWSLVIVRPHHFSRVAELKGGQEIRTHQARRAIVHILKLMNFNRAWALRHGRKKTYEVR